MLKMKVRSLRLLAQVSTLAISFLLLHSQSSAQMATAELAGTVLDSSGAAIPNATVTATNTATAISRSAVSEKGGEYVLTALPPGDYKIELKPDYGSNDIYWSLSDVAVKKGSVTELKDLVALGVR